MSGGLVADGPDRHAHELPDADLLKPGAVAMCDCGRFFVLDPIPWERTWRPVRWWDRTAKRVIRERAARPANTRQAEVGR